MTLRRFLVFVYVICAQASNCPKDKQHFEKVLGVRPEPETSRPTLLYKSNNDTIAVTTQCINHCQNNKDCISFVLFYNQSSCYFFKKAIADEDLEVDVNAAWFVKNCLKVNCSKLWVFERVPGAILVGNSTKTLPNTYTRNECKQYCLNETDFSCRSAKFRIQNDDKGVCVLSDADRHQYPGAYRASGYADEYFENQCSNKNYDFDGNFCSYDEYDNATLRPVDVFYNNVTKDECQKLCENRQDFNCRGYSIVGLSECFLHSEDSKVFGPKLLQSNYLGKYFERTACLNISVTCTETYMTIQYVPQTSFQGRIYMDGYSEQNGCFAVGSGNNAVILKLSLLGEQCGIIKARTQSDDRTLKGGTMIIQYNSLVQTQGDRVIRVGCIFGNDSKVLAGTSVTVTTVPNHASPLINSTGTGVAPSIEMRVVDLATQQEVSSTQIGQELQLIIELKPANGSLDIWAGHLVAMTADGDESILLLDDSGCPTNIDIFPGLTKITRNNTLELIGTFQAFKFSSSPIVRFSVIVQFCPNTCPAMNCGQRSRPKRAVETLDGTKIQSVNLTEFNKNLPRMPLEFIMIVKSPGVNSERLVLSDGKILVAGYDYIANEVCLDYSLFLGLIITWALIQVIFVVCAVLMVRKYKKYYEHESLRQSLEQLNKNFGIGFSNLDNRRVHWADNEEYT